MITSSSDFHLRTCFILSELSSDKMFGASPSRDCRRAQSRDCAALANAFRFTMRMPPRRTLFASFTTMSSAHIVYISPLDNIAMTTLWGFSRLAVSPRDSTMAPRVFYFFPWDGAVLSDLAKRSCGFCAAATCPSGLWVLFFEGLMSPHRPVFSDELRHSISAPSAEGRWPGGGPSLEQRPDPASHRTSGATTAGR